MGCNNRSIWNRSIKILAAEGVLAVRGGNPDRMIPKQNAGFRIYVVYWSKFKNWVPTDIGLGLVLSIHVLGYLILTRPHVL